MQKPVAIPCPLIGAMTISSAAMAQQTAPTPASSLQQSLAALTGQSAIQGLTLNGTAELIAGSTDEDWFVQCIVCPSTGSSQLQLRLPTASRTENRQITNGTPTGNWVDGQGEQHAMAGHNVLTPESWFCPNIALGRILQNNGLTIQFVETNRRMAFRSLTS